jgi:frataxin-like iron-binding protein CyaY
MNPETTYVIQRWQDNGHHWRDSTFSGKPYHVTLARLRWLRQHSSKRIWRMVKRTDEVVA